jgi:hypothetical protein
MTDPDPDKRPQRARDVVAILSKGRALSVVSPGAPARRPPRKMFRGMPEPLGTMMRLTVLVFAASGWFAMAVLQWTLLALAYVFSPLAFRKRKVVLGGAKEVASMLGEGREGFGELVRQTVATSRPRQLPPGE